MTPLQTEIYDQILQLQRQEKMDPKNNEADKLKFLEKNSWDTCVLKADHKRQLEEYMVEYHNVFVKHRFDVGCNTELNIKTTPEHPLTRYVQGAPAPIHLRHEI